MEIANGSKVSEAQKKRQPDYDSKGQKGRRERKNNGWSVCLPCLVGRREHSGRANTKNGHPGHIASKVGVAFECLFSHCDRN